MRPQLLHLSGPLRGRTDTGADSRLRIGSASDADVRLAAPGVAPEHAEIVFEEASCAFLAKPVGGRLFVNHAEVAEVMLQDDDLLEFGIDGPMARFRTYYEPGSVCKPVRRMLADARDVARTSGGGAGTSSLVRDLLTQASLKLKVGFPLAVLLLALPVAYLAGWLGARPALQRARTADTVTQAELEKLRTEMQQQRRELALLVQAGGAVRKIHDQWTRGVCLIHGVFGLRLPDGRPVSDSSGSRLEVEYTGSGFLASSAGEVVTNRHVVVPWENLIELRPLIAIGAMPEFRRWTATFPGRAPIPIPPGSVKRRSDPLDVALVLLPAAAVEGVPVLPLHQDDLGDLADRRAIVVGYPTGLAALLAKAETSLVDRLQAEGADMTRVIDALAAAGAVTPVLTEGIFTQPRPDLITYDAATTHGGSGGPVFGVDGTVIAVNYAILPGFAGSNFGVPIRYARELLAK